MKPHRVPFVDADPPTPEHPAAIRGMLREVAGSRFDEWYARGSSMRIEDALDAIPELG